MVNNIKKVFKSFKYATEGFLHCLKTQQNFRIHLVAVFFLCLITPFYNFTKTQIAIVILCCGFTIFSEVFNTAIEMTMDKITKSYDVDIKNIKDTASFFVLISAITSFLVAMTFYMEFDVIYSIIKFVLSSVLHMLFTVVIVVSSMLFIFSCNNKRS